MNFKKEERLVCILKIPIALVFENISEDQSVSENYLVITNYVLWDYFSQPLLAAMICGRN